MEKKKHRNIQEWKKGMGKTILASKHVLNKKNFWKKKYGKSLDQMCIMSDFPGRTSYDALENKWGTRFLIVLGIENVGSGGLTIIFRESKVLAVAKKQKSNLACHDHQSTHRSRADSSKDKMMIKRSKRFLGPEISKHSLADCSPKI